MPASARAPRRSTPRPRGNMPWSETKITVVEAHERERAPASWRVANPRFGDVVVVAPPDATLESDGLLGRVFTEGFHGYPPETPGMEALFLAAGPGIDPGTRLGRVRALDVAPTVLAILGVEPPEWMEGRPIEALVATAPQPDDAVVGGEAGG